MEQAEEPPDALLIDIGLPDADGRDLCQALRARGVDAPVLFLTARDAVTDRLAGFSAGGDDYVTKPFHFDEVVARLRALLRRSGADPATTIGTLRLDPVAHAISGDAGQTSLTPTEFRLLAALAAHPGAVVRRRDLVRAAWPDGAIVHDNTLDQYVARLRRKLREVSGQTAIATAHGVGYRLQ
jgi:two-component system response regulator MprA